MAVNVSTITSVCVYCKAKSNSGTDQIFHEICDEVGLELQLPSLVEKFFQIKVTNEEKKYLCDDCVNRLIELYDLQEYAKEKSLEAADLEYDKNVNHLPIKLEAEGSKNIKKTSCPQQETCRQQVDKVFQLSEHNEHSFISSPEIVLDNEFLVKQRGLNSRSQEINNEEEKTYQRVELKENLDLNEENTESLEHAEYVDEIDENFTDEETVINDVIEETQELSNLTANATIEISNSSEAVEEFGDVIENEREEVEDIFNTQKNEELKDNTLLSTTEDQLSEMENETINNDHDEDTNNDLYEQLDETLIDNNKTYEQINENRESVMSDMMHYTDDDNHNVAATKTGQKRKFNEIEFISISSNSQDAETADNAFNDKDTDCQFIITEDYESGETFENTRGELSNDSLSLEEEYLIDEISCSEEYDEVDLNEYLDKILLTKFQDLELKWETECKLCLSIHHTFEEILNHSCINEMEEEQRLCCVIKNCDQNTDNLATLARHLILTHYDKLESLAIYGQCPDCQKAFSNIFDFNKHSCCRSIKRKTGASNYCQYCDMDFQSLKRYVFHMQFHLTNRRPKVCLLCGALFKSSNDFFEHTQYQHVPETAMACIKCDRFFKDKEVFDQHISSHDTKYQYSCTFCPKKYTNKFILAQHMDIYHSNRPTTMKCKHCEKKFVNRISYRNHIKCHDTDVEVEAFICSTCGFVTGSAENIKYHIESDEDSLCFASQTEEKIISLVYTCENCSLDYHTVKQLKEHRLSKNHSDDLYVCGICRQTFKTLRHMRNHCTNHKDLEEWRASFPITRYFVCNIGDCQEFYPIWTTLYYHKKRPHKTNKSISADEYKCQFCQQICSSKMSLAVHVARSHNNSNVKCSYCKRSFKSQQHLQEHIDRYHTPVACDICRKPFKHRRNLDSHINLVHLNIKRYFCQHCGKGYFHKSEKDIHEKKVHPEVSYNCDLCNFVTNYSESLQVHMDKHNNQLKFKCTICDKAFGRKQLLQCHLKRHLNKKDEYLKDEGCNSSFLTYNLLKKHIEKKHPNSTYNSNLKSDTKLTITLKHHSDADETEDNSGGLWLDDGSASGTYTNNNEAFVQEDPIELIFEDDVQFDEQ